MASMNANTCGVRCCDVATRGGGRHVLRLWERYVSPQSEHMPSGAPVLLEEDAATVTKLLLVQLVSECLEIAVGLLVCQEEE
jgi:hypothetical protein